MHTVHQQEHVWVYRVVGAWKGVLVHVNTGSEQGFGWDLP